MEGRQMIQIITALFCFTSLCQSFYCPFLAPAEFCKDPNAQDTKCEVSL